MLLLLTAMMSAVPGASPSLGLIITNCSPSPSTSPSPTPSILTLHGCSGATPTSFSSSASPAVLAVPVAAADVAVVVTGAASAAEMGPHSPSAQDSTMSSNLRGEGREGRREVNGGKDRDEPVSDAWKHTSSLGLELHSGEHANLTEILSLACAHRGQTASACNEPERMKLP